MEEFRWILGKSDKEMSQLVHHGKIVMETLTKMMEEKDFSRSVSIVKIYPIQM